MSLDSTRCGLVHYPKVQKALFWILHTIIGVFFNVFSSLLVECCLFPVLLLLVVTNTLLWHKGVIAVQLE